MLGSENVPFRVLLIKGLFQSSRVLISALLSPLFVQEEQDQDQPGVEVNARVW